MGCLYAILIFVFFPIIYMWVQLRRGMNQLKKQQEEFYNQRSNQNRQEDEEPQEQQAAGKKKHVFKDGEGEYVDFEEER